ncbi:carbohydrate ABC transporter permease [Bauldia sp.]|uniref:carbohydrate ABC transporter permease n=1 Tax=Bauldia sp. TaxID=2575872 RepID=UPI003BA93214
MTPVLNFIRDRNGFDLILIGFSVLYLLVFAGLPFVFNVVMSFQQVDLFNVARLDRDFVGFENYRRVFNDPDFWLIAGNTAIFVGLSSILQLTIGFALALFFSNSFPGANWLRGLFLAAWITPAYANGQIWKWMLAGDIGIFNYGLESIGLIDEPVYWLSNPDLSLYSVILVNVWLGIPFYLLLISVGLSAIPEDLYEAAELDGANAFQRFFGITLPLMRDTVLALVALGAILTLQQFDLIAALTSGGPVNSSNVAQYWSWQLSFKAYQISLGSVVSVLMLLIVSVVAAIYVMSTRSERLS